MKLTPTILGFILLAAPSTLHALSNEEIIGEESNIENHAEIEYSEDEEKCVRLLKRIQTPLLEFTDVANLAKDDKLDLRVQIVLKMKKQYCTDEEWQPKVTRSLQSWLRAGSKKIAVFLPMSSGQSQAAQATLAGLKVGAAKENLDFEKHFKVFDTRGNPGDLKKVFAQAMLMYRPDMVIGGITPDEARFLEGLAETMRLPSLILNNLKDVQSDSNFIFKVFPNDRGLAVALAQTLKKQNLRRVAIFAPERRHYGSFVSSFRDQAKMLGLSITHDLSYKDGYFDYLDQAARQLLGINPDKRKDELKELIEKKKKEAEEKKVAFDEKSVLLPPIIDFDALFIPDHFRNLKHIVRLLKFHGVDRNIVLVGDQQWRAHALLSPFDPFLNGSFFVDYIGFYNELPSGLKVLPDKVDPKDPEAPTKEFIDPELAQETDFKLIGFRAGSIAKYALQKRYTTRRALAKDVRNHKFESNEFFAGGPGFDKNRLSYWPAFVFQINRQQIVLNTRYGPVSKPKNQNANTTTNSNSNFE